MGSDVRPPVIRELLGALGLSAALACGDPSDSGPPVDSLVITGAPVRLALLGSSIQLEFVAKDASGEPLTGIPTTWRSNDREVATVSTTGLVVAVGVGQTTVSVSARGRTAEVVVDVRLGMVVGPAGGVLDPFNGMIRLEVAPAALPENVTVLIRPLPTLEQLPNVILGTAFEIATATPVALSALLSIRYFADHIPGGLTGHGLLLVQLVNTTWVPVAGATLSRGTARVDGFISSEGIYALLAIRLASVKLDGPFLDGGLYQGASGQLVATGTDPFQTTFHHLALEWTSSSPGHASVEAGVVTGLALGPVTITASVGGISASTALMILPRPAPDWSQATTDWTTFQGNAEHTGFIPAVLGPPPFVERWAHTVGNADLALHPVTFGPGLAFVSTDDRFGAPRMLGLHLTTGAQVWTKSFGQIQAVHQPAYADGRVYVATSGHQDSYLYALDALTGADHFQVPYENQWSVHPAPIIDGDHVIMGGGYVGGVYAFDRTTGEERWFQPAAKSAPAVKDGRVYSYTPDATGTLFGLELASGAIQFQVADPGFLGGSGTSTPVLGPTNEVFLTQFSRLMAFDLANHRLAWEVKFGIYGMLPTLAEGVLYAINSGQLEARSPADGTLQWSWTPPVGALQGPMVATRNMLFASTAATTYALDLATGLRVWSYPMGGRLSLTPQGVLVIAGLHGVVRAMTVR